MDKERLKQFIGYTEMTIVDAMEKIDKNARGILFIVGFDQDLLGCVTDGDIRRWLIKTGDLKAPVIKAMNNSPKYLFSEEKKMAEEMFYREVISAIPILNRQKQIVDILLLSDNSNIVMPKREKTLAGIPVVIMAGGKGTRLYPYTRILPKPLIPIGELPIIERIINNFCNYGIDQYYISVNYKKGMIKSYFADLKSSYSISYIEEDKPLGTAGSIKLIDEIFEKPLFIVNCDALIHADYHELYDFHIKSGNDVTIVSALKNIVVPYGVLHPKENGELINIEEKPKLSYFINTGMYVINPKIIKQIPDDIVFHMTNLVDTVMENGGKVGMYPISEDSFLDMGEFDEMKRMEENLI